MAGKSSFLSRLFGRRQLAAPAVKRSEIAAFKGTLIAKGLTKSYKSRCVVNGVSLGVRAGNVVAVSTPDGVCKVAMASDLETLACAEAAEPVSGAGPGMQSAGAASGGVVAAIG